MQFLAWGEMERRERDKKIGNREREKKTPYIG